MLTRALMGPFTQRQGNQMTGLYPETPYQADQALL